MSGVSDPYQEEVLTKLAESAARYNRWLFQRTNGLLGARVVDVGAGIGTFTDFAAHAGRDVVALEPDGALIALLTERFRDASNVRVLHGDVNDLTTELLGFRADSVLCLNVLEHVCDDADALRRVREALVPEGRLFLLVPAHEWLFGSLDRSAKHERRYTKDGLRRLLESGGFAVRTLRHVNPLGIAGWFVWGRILKAPGLPTGPLGAYDRLVPLLRVLDAVRLPIGLSLWAVGERRD
jgi:SAM-dependent methyltransferase